MTEAGGFHHGKNVNRYLNYHEIDELKEDWIMLQRFYPAGTWTM